MKLRLKGINILPYFSESHRRSHHSTGCPVLWYILEHILFFNIYIIFPEVFEYMYR